MITPIDNSAVSPQTVGFISSSHTISPAARHAISHFQSSMEGGLLQNLRKQVGKLFNHLVDQVSGRQPSSSRLDGIMARHESALHVRGIADRAPQQSRDFRQPYQQSSAQTMQNTPLMQRSHDSIQFGQAGAAQAPPTAGSLAGSLIARDSVFLGRATDYAQPILAVRIGEDVKPVRHENGQIVARHVDLGNAAEMAGALIFCDGSELPLKIDIWRAV